MSEKTQRLITLLVGVLVMSLTIGYIVFAWVEPTASPPGGNVPAPINVGDAEQVKSGRIGIGVSDADDSYQLTVATKGIKITNDGTSPTLYVEDVSGDTTPFVIDSDGNVGIGTTGPGYKLDVAGTIRARDVFAAGGQNIIVGDDTYLTDVDQANILGIYGMQNSDRAGIRLGSDGSLIFGDNGNIGIGTTSPTYTLDVNGTIATPYLKSPFDGDVNKDGDIDSYDIILVSRAFGCWSGQPCWNEVIGADNLGNRLYKKDADLNGDGRVDMGDIGTVTSNYVHRQTPYTREPKTGDINKDGYVNHEDLFLVIVSFGCRSTNPCWNDRIGADNLSNPLYKRDADVHKDNRIDMADIGDVIDHYEPFYYFTSDAWESLPAARFRGDTIITSHGYLQIKKTSAGAPSGEDCDDSAELGRFVIDTTQNRLYICMGATRGWDWIPLND